MLNESKRFAECAAGYQASFSPGEIEWLLQVLNDVRIGSWLALGSPDQQLELREGMTKQTMSHLVTMEMAGYFESCFLDAILWRSANRK